YCGHAGAGADKAWALQERVCGGYSAKEAVRCGKSTADGAASGCAIPGQAECGSSGVEAQIYQPSLRAQRSNPSGHEGRVDCFVATLLAMTSGWTVLNSPNCSPPLRSASRRGG